MRNRLRPISFWIALAVVSAVTGFALAQEPPAAQRKLIGLDAVNAMIGNTLVSNTEEDGLGAFYFGADHILKRRQGSESQQFTWSVQDQKFCVKETQTRLECSNVEVEADHAKIFSGHDPSQMREGVLIRGNPLHL